MKILELQTDSAIIFTAEISVNSALVCPKLTIFKSYVKKCYVNVRASTFVFLQLIFILNHDRKCNYSGWTN